MDSAYSRLSMTGPPTASAAIMIILVEIGAQQRSRMEKLTNGGTATVAAIYQLPQQPLQLWLRLQSPARVWEIMLRVLSKCTFN